ncbi:clr5 domain [Diplodia corticola]|uniref:Clr5 domain n=1 Tax=Diplodia corticola TaxID=236234 RepID=A0A1J9R580_9PEZI|nr:clr5 domain [Diplodia corticola]OJD35386.1 clr5 domain [Diplodia corticola]
MVYDWEGKEPECYRMYVEEKRSLDEVMDFWKVRNFTPSKRAFQTQFKRWDFPSKQNPAHKNPELVARVKELWETNTTQRDMLQILNDEGFDLKERELMRVRAKNRWLLRVPNGMKGETATAARAQTADTYPEAFVKELQQAIADDGEMPAAATPQTPGQSLEEPSADPDPETLRKRKERMEKLQQESDERWRARKRRRRMRGWAGLPADPAGPPRFPSETTIDESKAYLSLDNELYRQLRDQFQTICEEEGVVKKTIAGPDKWQQVKDRLIAENDHLRTQFVDEQGDKPDQKSLSLDVICTDVTKRMRTMERRMTIADAKNIIGVNPEESRLIRRQFYEMLKSSHVNSKLETGPEHWQELKDKWITGSPVLQRMFTQDNQSPQHPKRLKALEVLCRDVMKRLRDDETKRDPSRKKHLANAGPGPGPAPPRVAQTPARTQRSQSAQDSPTKTPTAYAPTTPTPATSAAPGVNSAGGGDLQIDPSLLLAANDLAGQHQDSGVYHNQTMHQQQQGYSGVGHSGQQQQAREYNYTPAYADQAPTPIPVYFRLHPHSQIQSDPRIWLGALTSGTMEELRALATRVHPGSSAVRIEGVVKGQDFREVNYPIDDNEELGGYLAHMSAGKVTFAVQLA